MPSSLGPDTVASSFLNGALLPARPTSLLAQVGQPTPSATPQPQDWRWHGMSAGDISQTLALPLSLFVAYLTVRLTIGEQRRSALLTELVNRCNDVQERSDRLAVDHTNHLTGKPTGNLSQDDSHRQITLDFKTLRRRVEFTGAMIPEKEKAALLEAFQHWWQQATDAGYPILDASRAFRATDSRITDAQRQHEEWDKHVATLKTSCLQHKVKI